MRWAMYVHKVRDSSHRITDGDVATLAHWDTDTDRMRLAAGLNRVGYRVPYYLVR